MMQRWDALLKLTAVGGVPFRVVGEVSGNRSYAGIAE